MTLTGANFTGATVLLDRTVVTPQSQTDTQITLRMPRHDNGYVVIKARSSSGIAYAEFLYVPPRLDEIAPGAITTVAGVGTFVRDYGRATEANVKPNGLAFDGNGNLYIASANLDRIFRVSNGNIEPFAGIGRSGLGSAPGGDDGPAVDAFIYYCRSVAFDPEGNAFIPDVNGHSIRRVDPSGIITTFAGNGTAGFSGDGGPAVMARIGEPTFIAADKDDVFFFDWLGDGARIRRVHKADGTISTFCGDGKKGFSGDGGPAAAAEFDIGTDDDGGMALDPTGNLWFCDRTNKRVRRIDRSTGIITTAMMTLDPAGPEGIAVDPSGNVYYGGFSGAIRKHSPNGTLLATWGGTTPGFSPDGTDLSKAKLGAVVALAIDADGNVVFSELSTDRVRRINIHTGRLETLAGMGPRIIGETGPAIGSVFTALADVEVAPNGDLIFADVGENRVRRIDRQGNISTVAGNGLIGPTEGVPATATGLSPLAIDLRPDGSMDLALWLSVWRLNTAGTLEKIVVNNCLPALGDGMPASQASLCQAWDTARDADGNLYIADTNNNRIRRVDARTQIMSTFAGNNSPISGFERWGHGSFCGDGGPAFDACLNTPYGLAFDSSGNLFVTDFYNQLIRKIDRQGIITTFATDILGPKLKFDAAGFLYVVEVGNHVLRYAPDGRRTTIAGTGTAGFSGDAGPAVEAQITAPAQGTGIAIDAEGNVFFADQNNNRIRAVRYGAVLAPSGAAITATAAGSTIRAIVKDETGRPAPGVRVDFIAPTSGASCTLSSTFAITDPNGIATVSCTSNCVAGSYEVNAQPLTASSTASVSFKNDPCPGRRRAARH